MLCFVLINSGRFCSGGGGGVGGGGGGGGVLFLFFFSLLLLLFFFLPFTCLDLFMRLFQWLLCLICLCCLLAAITGSGVGGWWAVGGWCWWAGVGGGCSVL